MPMTPAQASEFIRVYADLYSPGMIARYQQIADSTDGYDSNGYDSDGYNADGVDDEGYDRGGYNEDGIDRDGYDSDGYNADGYNRDGYNEDGYDRWGNAEYSDDDEPRGCGCSSCERSYGRDSGLLSYRYTPELKFNGESGPYYGMEIEVTTDHTRALVDIVRSSAGDLVYCKSDSSVQGAEMVTHPMSYEWAMAHFPWDMLGTIRTECDGTVVPQENGIHVHVGRDGFTDSAHMYRWMKLWYRNPSDVQRIARRRAGNWSAFNPEHRKGQKEHVKRGKPTYVRRNDGTIIDRYSAINTTNTDTLEVRVFASTLRPQRAKAALQLVAASVEYTRNLTTDVITHRHGWDWPAFMAWAAKSGQYPDLVAENRIRRPV
jgi:hypothetical protein